MAPDGWQGVADYSDPQASSRSAWDMPWLVVFAAGVALVVLARVIYFFSHFDNIADKDKATAVFSLLGSAALPSALALVSLFQRGLGWGTRAALAIGAAYFLLVGAGFKLA